MGRIYTVDESQGVVKRLQELLNLGDWDISVGFKDQSVLEEQEAYASIEYTSELRKAKITLVNPDTYSDKFEPEYDMILSLTHELLHLYFDPIAPRGDDGRISSEVCTEQEVVINKLCRIFAEYYDDDLEIDMDAADAECIYTPQELQEACAKWQDKFGLSNWDLDIDFIDQQIIVDKFAIVSMWKYTLHAFIGVPHPARYASASHPKQNMLWAILHELTHLIADSIMVDKPYLLYLQSERVCNAISRSIIALTKAYYDKHPLKG